MVRGPQEFVCNALRRGGLPSHQTGVEVTGYGVGRGLGRDGDDPGAG